MQKQAKLFISGNSQAVRLPKEFRFDSDQVYIRREGDTIILTPRPSNWDGFLDGCAPLSDDFSITGTPLPNDMKRTEL